MAGPLGAATTHKEEAREGLARSLRVTRHMGALLVIPRRATQCPGILTKQGLIQL